MWDVLYTGNYTADQQKKRQCSYKHGCWWSFQTVVQRSYIFYSNLHNKVIKLTEKHNIHNILKNYKNNSIQNLVPSIPQQYIVQMVLLLEVINIHAKLLLSDCALCLQPGRRKLQSYTDVLLISTWYSWAFLVRTSILWIHNKIVTGFGTSANIYRLLLV